MHSALKKIKSEKKKTSHILLVSKIGFKKGKAQRLQTKKIAGLTNHKLFSGLK